MASGVDRLRALADYASYGGAPILGFEQLLIKAHRRSTPQSIANAVKVAAKAVRDHKKDAEDTEQQPSSLPPRHLLAEERHGQQ